MINSSYLKQNFPANKSNSMRLNALQVERNHREMVQQQGQDSVLLFNKINKIKGQFIQCKQQIKVSSHYVESVICKERDSLFERFFQNKQTKSNILKAYTKNKQECIKYEKQNKPLKQNLLDQKSKLSTLQKQKVDILDRKSQVDNEIIKFEQKCQKLKIDIDVHKKAINKVTKSSRYGQLKVEVNSNQVKQQFQVFGSKYSITRQKINQQNIQLSTLQKLKNNSLLLQNQLYECLQERIDYLTNIKQKIDKNKHKIDTVSHQNYSLQKTIQTFENQLFDLKQQLKIQINEVQAQQNTLKNKQFENIQLKAKLQILQHTLKDLISTAQQKKQNIILKQKNQTSMQISNQSQLTDIKILLKIKLQAQYLSHKNKQNNQNQFEI